MKQLSDALGMLTAQLYVLSNSSTLAPVVQELEGLVPRLDQEAAAAEKHKSGEEIGDTAEKARSRSRSGRKETEANKRRDSRKPTKRHWENLKRSKSPSEWN